MAYARERDDIIVVPRYDICLDHDILIIEKSNSDRTSRYSS